MPAGESEAGVASSPAVLTQPSSFGRVAVVHDWLTGMRGGEAVLEAILDVVPEAELFTLFHFAGSVSPQIESRVIHTSRLQNMARRVGDYRRLLPLFPQAARAWDFRPFDLVISSSHCVAKGINARGLPHLCYCHTPMRYIWDRFDDYFPPSKPLVRLGASVVAPYLRRWDVRTAGEVTKFVANSRFVQERIARYYGREAEVVHPFVDDAFLAAPLNETREDFDVIVSALVPYKRVELAVETATVTGRRLVVIGGGPLLPSLRERVKAHAGLDIELLGSVSREVIIDVVSRARSLILPGIEDFGITPLEAMALGTPVVALRGGGALDTVVERESGVFFEQPVVESLAEALHVAGTRVWDRRAIRARAAQFSRGRFVEQFRAALGSIVRQ
jgi:glycosyltransferase involved in cell wall biosynthesis